MNRRIPKVIYFMLGHVLVAIVVMSLLHFSILKPLSYEKANALLSNDLNTIAAILNGKLDEKMNALSSLKSYVDHTLKPGDLRYNDSKLTAYANSLEPHLLQMAFGFEDAYVVFLKSYFGFYHDRWYFDANRDGIPEKMKELPESYFDGDQVSKAWYYKPISVKRPVWIGPYESTALKGTYFITYTTLLQKSGEPMMLIGIDFEFTEFKNQIANYAKLPSAHLYLLNENKEVMVSSLDSTTHIVDSHNQQDTLLFASEIASQQVMSVGQFQYRDAKNQVRIGKFIPLNNGWYLGLTINQNVLDDAMRPQATKIYLLVCSWMLLVIASSFIFFKYTRTYLSKIHQKEQLALTSQISLLEAKTEAYQTLQTSVSAQKVEVLEKELIQMAARTERLQMNEQALKHRMYLLAGTVPLSSQKIKSTIEMKDPHIVTFSIKGILHQIATLYSESYPDYQCQVIVALEQDFYVHSRQDYYHAIFSAMFELCYHSHFEPFEHYFIKVTLAHPQGVLNIRFEDDGKINTSQISAYANRGFESATLSLEDTELPLYLLHDLVVNQLFGSLLYFEESNRNIIDIQIQV